MSEETNGNQKFCPCSGIICLLYQQYQHSSVPSNTNSPLGTDQNDSLTQNNIVNLSLILPNIQRSLSFRPQTCVRVLVSLNLNHIRTPLLKTEPNQLVFFFFNRRVGRKGPTFFLTSSCSPITSHV